MFSHNIIMDKTCACEKCAHSVRRQPSPLQHMLGCLAEATACLTAASVCYEHGPVSTPLSSPSLHPPLLYASLSVLCLTFITLSLSLSAYPGCGTSSIPHSPSFGVKQSQIGAGYYHGAVCVFISWLFFFELCVFFLFALIFHLPLCFISPSFTASSRHCWLCFWVFWSKWGAAC